MENQNTFLYSPWNPCHNWVHCERLRRAFCRGHRTLKIACYGQDMPSRSGTTMPSRDCWICTLLITRMTMAVSSFKIAFPPPPILPVLRTHFFVNSSFLGRWQTSSHYHGIWFDQWDARHVLDNISLPQGLQLRYHRRFGLPYILLLPTNDSIY